MNEQNARASARGATTELETMISPLLTHVTAPGPLRLPPQY